MNVKDGDKDNMLAFMVNKYAIGFALKLKVSHPLYKNFLDVDLEIEFKYNFKKGIPSFKFRFDINGPDFISLFKDGIYWLARSVKGFYGKIGDIIALGDFDELEDAAKWSVDAVKNVKNKILKTVKNIPKEIYNFAADKVKTCGTKYVEGLKCGAEAIVGKTKCAYKTVTSISKCGSDLLRNWKKCGWEVI